MYFLGEVPGANNGHDVMVVDSIDSDFVALPFPAAFTFGNSELAQSAPNGSRLNLWDQDAKQYRVYHKGGRAGSWGLAADLVIAPGQAFFLELGGTDSYDWTVPKPYDFP